MEYKIRPATAADAAAAAGIYAPYIGTTVTFESPAPDEAEMARRIEEVTAFYPWLVCERSGEVIGYSYAHRFRTRAAFDWAVELSVYLSPAAKGRGIGTALYTAVTDILRRQGCVNAIGVVATPNAPSERLHESCGFERLFTMESIGWKLGCWCDMTYYMLRLNPTEGRPEPMTAWTELPGDFILGVCEAHCAGIKEL